ncbi:MAG TPA: DUF1428 domain-containing protein [Ferrovibrio sp.]|uniref:DUF1428 domain-containing protein n=1 Tax=Ferrovibrio sp. TaxID=1917215 RepID=UPI002ED37834
MSYVDGFLLAVPRRKLAAYRKMAALAGKVWREHGALDFRECVGEDLSPGMGLPFPKLMKLKRGEVPVFSFIVFKSRAHRDRVNKKVLGDPRLKDACDPNDMPFDPKRMCYGGFQTIVE